MGSKYEFDETRDAIGADGLTPDERKAMFEKFQSSGGKVVDEKLLKNKAGLKSGSSGKISRAEYYEKKREEAAKKAQIREGWEKQKKKLGGPSARFFIKLRCWMGGLAPFGKAEVNADFMASLAVDVKQALVEFNLLGNDLFFRKPAIGNKIVKALDAKNTLFMEVLERAHSLYNADEYNKLIDFYSKNPKANTPLELIEEPLKKLFLRLYYISPYQETLRRAFNLAYDIFRKEFKENSDVDTLGPKQKKIQKDLRLVFQQTFGKLLLLISRIDGMDYAAGSPFLEKAIEVKNEDKIGKRKSGDLGSLSSASGEIEDSEENPEGESTENKTEEGQEEKEEVEEEENPVLQTKEYQYGMNLMKMYSLAQLAQKHDPRKRYNAAPLKDKVLLSFLYFLEFDTEYSFVLTTNKIQMNVDYSGTAKNDYKRILADVYNESRDIIKEFEKYVEAKKEFKNVMERKTHTNYIEQSKLETKIKSNAEMQGRLTRGLIRTYMSDTSKNLAILISDMKEKKQIVLNMDEALKFSSDIEGNKRLNGKSVSECIMTAYCFATALKERLTTGDFFGGIIEIPDEEMAQIFGENYKIALEQYNS
ncbi:MAG: hypothetical protein OEZ13_10375 [Spirochaetia bacterium]|nr:hypothetical protein [Spirochaetia bacterium]